MDDIYHKAARDGYIDLLKTASKRDTNRKDEDGMTPVHYASSCGNVEALRLLVGKGGDPDKSNFDGATSVHLAANCGQLNCLSFLTNFGCNIWALNNDGRTPLEDAAYHGRMDCVRHLDGLIAIQMMQNKKEVKKQKLHAKQEAIKRVKKQSKFQQERDKAYDRRVKNELEHQYDHLGLSEKMEDSNGNWGKKSTRSMYSDHSFSELASGRGFEEEDKNLEAISTHAYSDTFSQRSRLFQALKGKINNTLRKKKPRDDDLFNKRTSISQPELFQGTMNSIPSNSLKDERPQPTSSDSLTSGSDNSDQEDTDDLPIGHIIKTYDDSGNVSTEIHYDHSSSSKANGTVTSRPRQGSSSSSRSAQSHDAVSLRSAGFDEHENLNEIAGSNEMRDVITFLSTLNLEQFSSPFLKESIDLNALVLCSDKDLQELGLPLGPRRKILEAVRRRQVAIQSPGTMADTKI
ncbi:hypothetical protein QZH41_011665 [Actinostola sp. cb2023]|nr:hypothetical protein QZH41_011665 [Actinostola sp. cb2023]